MSNAYKDYLENWAWEKATGLFKRLRTRKSNEKELNSEGNIALPAIDTISVEQTENDDSDYFQGLENFPFHITMLLLLVIMSSLNFGLSIAWIKSH